MPIKITDKTKCTGCAACVNVCPKDCIELKEDSSGFSYPFVDMEKCIECDLCIKKCPVLFFDKNKKNEAKPQIYAAQTRNSELRFESTSGGIFTELAKQILEQGGKVCGAAYNDRNLVEHILVSDKSGLNKIRQSKYIQSEINTIYRQIKEKLKYDKPVAFCGAPCQVAGLYNYLGKRPENLFTFDFICRGMNSPKAYEYWLKEIEEKTGSKVTRVWFKYKENGWKKSPKCTRVDFKNGKYEVFDGKKNTFMCGYLGPNLYIRPACGDCQFKGFPRIGDITLADFWGLNSQLEDDRGTSLVMINNQRGQRLFDEINSNLSFESHDVEEIIAGNLCAKDSVVINPKSSEFLNRLGTKDFSLLVKEYTHVGIMTKILRKAKSILKK